MRPRTFACPSCGAPLTALRNHNEVACPYCGMSVLVPAELRSGDPFPHPSAANSVSAFPTPPTSNMQDMLDIADSADMPKAPRRKRPPAVPPASQPQIIIQREGRRPGCGCGGGCGCLGIAMMGFMLLTVIVALAVIYRPPIVRPLLAKAQDAVSAVMDAPQIYAFNVLPVSENSAIVAGWATNADSVTLDWITPQGTQNVPDLPALSQQVFVADNITGETTLRLTAIKGGKTATRSVPITIRRGGPTRTPTRIAR